MAPAQLKGFMLGFLFLVTATLTLQSTTMDETSNDSSFALPGCPDKCGNVSIPYPFGISPNCFLDGFQIYCDPDEQVPYLSKDKSLKALEINLPQGEFRVQIYIASECVNNGHIDSLLQLDRDHFTVSCTKNMFTAIGCATIAMIGGENKHDYSSLCGSFCSHDSIADDTACTGMGCCQISIPCNLHTLNFSFLELVDFNYTAVRSFNPCSYAFVAETDWFKFNTSYVTSTDFRTQYGIDGLGVPMVLDWAINVGNCKEAKMNLSSYACRAIKSDCIDTTINNTQAYRCNCSRGYDGNPYLDNGCKDIHECDYPSKYPCNGKCVNTDGSYNCSCPYGTQSVDPTKFKCIPIPQTNESFAMKFVIGTGIGFIVLVICIFALVIKCHERKLAKEKEKFFKQNGGQILYQQILSQQVDTVKIFTIDDMMIATNNFDKSKELGTGGHGTVYKGVLRDNKLVAVKRSKVMNVYETEEFVQEIIILSQINHKNVVRLLGCCLEVEVPILVYEYIPNGTLFHFIHGSDGRLHVSLEARLRIAQESAEALAYMHLSINNPIVHGDVKSLNILLDENYIAKVTDFGASRVLPKNAVQFMTMVQGTLGYLDPEYLQERKLTNKSDVYSFGVVLLELITRKTAIYSEGLEEETSLASSFIQAMKEGRVEDMLDNTIMCVGMEDLLQEVSTLGAQCLSIKGEDRPSMTQVADKLKVIRSTWRELLLLKHKENGLSFQDQGNASSGVLLPSMYWTARRMGMDIETQVASNNGSTIGINI